MAAGTTVFCRSSNPNFNQQVEDVLNGKKGAEYVLARDVAEYVKEKESELTFWQSLTIFTGIAGMGAAVVGYFVGRRDGRAEVIATLPGNQSTQAAESIKKADEIAQRGIFYWW